MCLVFHSNSVGRKLTTVSIYEGYSINKVNFPKEMLFTIAHFSKKSIMKGPFMSQRTVSMTFSVICYARNVFINEESVCFKAMYSLFDWRSSWWTHIRSICKQFIQTWSSVQIICVDFTWFGLLSHQTFDDGLIFKPGALSDLPSFWIASKESFFFQLKQTSFAMS